MSSTTAVTCLPKPVPPAQRVFGHTGAVRVLSAERTAIRSFFQQTACKLSSKRIGRLNKSLSADQFPAGFAFPGGVSAVLQGFSNPADCVADAMIARYAAYLYVLVMRATNGADPFGRRRKSADQAQYALTRFLRSDAALTAANWINVGANANPTLETARWQSPRRLSVLAPTEVLQSGLHVWWEVARCDWDVYLRRWGGPLNSLRMVSSPAHPTKNIPSPSELSQVEIALGVKWPRVIAFDPVTAWATTGWREQPLRLSAVPHNKIRLAMSAPDDLASDRAIDTQRIAAWLFSVALYIEVAHAMGGLSEADPTPAMVAAHLRGDGPLFVSL